MTAATATLPQPLRRRSGALARRILGSSLLEALTYPHGVDRYSELLRPGFSLSEPRARVLEVFRPARGMVGLTLRPNGNWDGFRAGQFARVGVEVDGVWHTRCYSPSRSAHDPDLIELTVRVHSDGVVSQYVHERAREGMVVKLSDPQGEFFLPEERPPRMTMVSGGSGITPVISMLRTLRDEGSGAEVTFLHYARSPEHVPYAAELDAIAHANPNVTVAYAFTRDGGGRGGDAPRGHFTPDHLEALGVEPGAAEAFVCGPNALIDAVRQRWTSAGAEHRFHCETFTPHAITVADADAEGTVKFAVSGIEVANDGRTLLEQAEAAGLGPEHGCRMGICHSCRCRVAAGAVRDVRSGAVSELHDAEAQLCVSVPASDIELEI